MTVLHEPPAGLCCDRCGYERTGLPGDARCPECGAAPPVPYVGPVDDLVKTANDAAWLRTVAVGSVLLLLSSYAVFQVAVLMPVGSFSISAVNFAGPKVQGIVMVQRSLGGHVGSLGVTGLTAALLGVAGVWLLTSPRSLGTDGSDSSGRGLATATRWTAVVTAGAVMGGTLDFEGGYVPPMQNFAGWQILIALVCCELPTNLLLYLFLRKLNSRLRCRRAAKTLVYCSWLVPLVILLGGLLQFGQLGRTGGNGMTWQTWNNLTSEQRTWAAVSGAYGGLAIATSVAAAAAVVQLLATAAAAGFGAWAGKITGGAGGFLSVARRLYDTVDRDLPRWGAVAGLLFWVYLLPWSAASLFQQEMRQGLMGDVPLINFLGPVVDVPRVNLDRGEFESSFINNGGSACLLVLAAVWAITGLRGPGKIRFGTAARWWATAGVTVPTGVLLGLRMTDWRVHHHPNLPAELSILLGGIPATVLAYLHLSALATGAGAAGLSRRFKLLAGMLPVVMGLPMIALVLSRRMHGRWQSPEITVVAAVEVSVATAMTFVAASAVVKLAWVLAGKRELSPVNTVGVRDAGV